MKLILIILIKRRMSLPGYPLAASTFFGLVERAQLTSFSLAELLPDRGVRQIVN
jgi:hypothetical protein